MLAPTVPPCAINGPAMRHQRSRHAPSTVSPCAINGPAMRDQRRIDMRKHACADLRQQTSVGHNCIGHNYISHGTVETGQKKYRHVCIRALGMPPAMPIRRRPVPRCSHRRGGPSAAASQRCARCRRRFEAPLARLRRRHRLAPTSGRAPSLCVTTNML